MAPGLRVLLGGKGLRPYFEKSFVFHGRITFPEGKGFEDFKEDRAKFLDFDRLNREFASFSARNEISEFNTSVSDRHLDYVLKFPNQESLDNWIKNVPPATRFSLLGAKALGYHHDVIHCGKFEESVFLG
ncbi:MAG: hypothetical protein IT288_04585 [Bdellovibrionales bacterium]|nr:hypothetical protein [Bdellovibrionales bacterium]